MFIRSVRASRDERSRALPGDEFMSEPLASLTHAITIRCERQPLVTWAFVLEESETGATRLIVRARGSRGYRFHGLPWSIARLIVPLVHFVMQRKQLLGIAQRAEEAHAEELCYAGQPAH